MRQPFPCKYEIEENAELPPDGRGEVFYYPGAKRIGGSAGLMIKVKPENRRPWIACFPLGYRSPVALTEVFSCPNPYEACVISSGEAYVIRIDDPTNWQKLPCFPVTQVLEMPARGLLVFCDFTKLVALGSEGVKWVSQRLAIDELKILAVENRGLRVSAWRGGRRMNIETLVDLSTGEELANPNGERTD